MKPILPSTLTPEMPVGLAAARLLNAKRQEVAAHSGAALAGDIEGIHDLRVAVKRLRETMRLFRAALPRRRGKELLGLVDELNDALGAVRDRDVLAEHAEALGRQLPEAEGLLARVTGAWAAEREGYFAELAVLWERLTGSEQLNARLRELAALTRRRQRAANREPLDRFASAAVTTRLERVSAHLRETRDQSDPAVLHRLRILVKRLKYSLEPILPALPALEGPYAPVAALQESLGLTHDLDVLHAALSERLRPRRSKAARALLEHLATRRAEAFAAVRGPLAIVRSHAWRRSLLDGLD